MSWPKKKDFFLVVDYVHAYIRAAGFSFGTSLVKNSKVLYKKNERLKKWMIFLIEP